MDAIDYMAILAEHMQAALSTPGQSQLRSCAQYGEALRDAAAREQIAAFARSHGYAAEFSEYLGNWSLSLRKN